MSSLESSSDPGSYFELSSAIAQFMFPHAYDFDLLLLKPEVRLRIALLVASHLCSPELLPDTGGVPAYWAAVPKAPVNENNKTLCGEKEVGFSYQILGVQNPAVDASAHQSHAQCRLCAFVALAFD
jgi:hypothetical protein